MSSGSWLHKGVKRGWHGRKLLIFMRFHGVFLGNQHEIWSKQHNGNVRIKHWVFLFQITINRVVYALFRAFLASQNKGRSLCGRLSHRQYIPEHITPLFALKHPDVTLLAPHCLLKSLEQIRGAAQ